jgi:uncharacterized membrane protein YfcA
MIMDTQTIHNVLIILHASAATVSFFAGCLLIFVPAYTSHQGLFSLYEWFLIGMVMILLGAILVYWTEYSNAERIIFSGLFVLGCYMLYRARRASHLIKTQQNNWKQEYIKHIGFTLISLFEGFIIVGGLDIGVPGWLIALLAIFGVFTGNWAIGLAQRRTER